MNILIVDDNQSLVRGLLTFLREEGHSGFPAGTVQEAKILLEKRRFDLVITDLKLPDGEGLEVVKRARAVNPPPEVILMTAFGTVDTAVEAMKLGAQDYLTKPVPLEEFAFRIDRVGKLRQVSERVEKLERTNATLLESTGLTSPLQELVGDSPGMRGVKELLAKAAPFPSTVLLTGETGTGKEMVARAIHALSPGAQGPFVRVNCASIPDTLFESELFGHEKGAFTDARERRIGRFEAAQGGTLFLDEVGEVPAPLQPKLLRALQEKEIVRVGSSQPILVDTRIVAATNRNLDRMSTTGEFREDLLYRLAVIRIPIPPLRERREDIVPLANRLLERLRSDFGKPGLAFSPESLEILKGKDWRGNIRELRNAIERAVVLSEGDLLGPGSFEPGSSEPGSSEPVLRVAVGQEDRPGGGAGSLPEALEKLERSMIISALRKSDGVKARAAEELGIPRTNLLYRMKKLGLQSGED